MESYERLSAYFEHINNYDQSLEYYRRYLGLNDSLFNEENSQRMEKLKISYELDKAQGQLLLMQQDKVLREAELHRKNTITFAAVLLGLLALAFGVYMYKTSRKQKLINEELHAQKEEIESQKEEIESQKEEMARLYEAVQSQHNDIQHSILYAKRIQEAMLPDIGHIQEHFPESFVLFLPKDVVSGDLYWFAELGAHAVFQEAPDMSGNRVFMGFESPKTVIAAVDCTGHGVPGGFMSMIAHNALNDIVIERHITSPDEILRQLHLHVQKALRQQTSKIQDGMDIALCVIDTENKRLEYAGAKNPLIYIQNGQLYELRPDRYSIGGLWNEELHFEKHSIALDSPTQLYLCSDGYQDQFGGSQNRKFMKNRFKELLLSLHTLPMQSQEEALAKTLEEWKGQEAQTDDILILGLQV
jgi:serine phosphatase RsbU (regulator of sigma subunit)